MGANAVTTVPVYTAGEVLTAADMNITNSGIPVFASTVERDAAFGGTGEKTLAEGQFAYLETGNVTQYYDGAAWQPVGVTPGLVCVKAETAFSAVANFTADGVFTSSYTNYRILLRVEQSNDVHVTMVLRAATVDATSNYFIQRNLFDNTSTNGLRISSTASANVVYPNNSAQVSSAALELFGPQLAAATQFTSYVSNNYATNVINTFLVGGVHSTATAYDGIKFAVATGTMTGTYTIYAYSKTV
jgi:hypothetical protein